MRILKFIVNGQSIEKDPNCDFSGLVPGTKGYLKAEFTFSPEWDGCAKIVGFYSNMGKEYPPKILVDGVSCRIPTEALARRVFKVQVIGGGADGYTIKTNKVAVCQNGG
jgi:hypothetical protein